MRASDSVAQKYIFQITGIGEYYLFATIQNVLGIKL